MGHLANISFFPKLNFRSNYKVRISGSFLVMIFRLSSKNLSHFYFFLERMQAETKPFYVIAVFGWPGRSTTPLHDPTNGGGKTDGDDGRILSGEHAGPLQSRPRRQRRLRRLLPREARRRDLWGQSHRLPTLGKLTTLLLLQTNVRRRRAGLMHHDLEYG